VYAIEYETFFRKNAQLIACVTPVWSEYLAKAREMYLVHRSELEPLVTHRLPIREAETAFTLYDRHADGIIKALIDMTGW
jgi:threonine dehydrogenase-like Zn-dependent dehydrogenase